MSLNRRTISKSIFFLFLILVCLYTALYMYKYNALTNKGILFNNAPEINCIKSICVTHSGVKECIDLKSPLLLNKIIINDINNYLKPVVYVNFEVLNENCGT